MAMHRIRAQGQTYFLVVDFVDTVIMTFPMTIQTWIIINSQITYCEKNIRGEPDKIYLYYNGLQVDRKRTHA